LDSQGQLWWYILATYPIGYLNSGLMNKAFEILFTSCLEVDIIKCSVKVFFSTQLSSTLVFVLCCHLAGYLSENDIFK
jgi:hypothetical protein